MTPTCPKTVQSDRYLLGEAVGTTLADDRTSGSNAGSEPSAGGRRHRRPPPSRWPAVEAIDGDPRLLLLCDHASNAIPPGVELRIDPALLDRHVAVDIGAAALTRALAAVTGGRALFGTATRLVVDLNRAPDDPAVVPRISDGHAIPGNVDIDVAERLRAYHTPYHAAVADAVAAEPALIVAVHSFTPRLESGNAPERRWQVGVLSNTDRRAADLAIAFLEGEELIVGDNEPYSGKLLNATLDTHAEANGIASICIELRNDLIRTAEGIAAWTAILARMIEAVRNGLASRSTSAT